jgi:hypothetical protein
MIRRLSWLVVLWALLLPAALADEEPKKPTEPASDEKPKEAAPLQEEEAATEPDEKDEELPTDPTQDEVPLPALAGWNATLVMDNDGVGVWTVKSYPVWPHLACPEIVGLDDKGRMHVLTGYSGKWWSFPIVNDGRWLGGLAFDDVDPRIEGSELYAGSQRGNVYQVVPYRHATLDCRLIAHFAGREVHTVVAGDFDPTTKGRRELLVFTRPGALFRLTPTGEHGRFERTKLQDLDGRVRDAVVLPGSGRELATVSRAGRLALLSFETGRPQWQTLYRAPTGMGRVALKPYRPEEPLVLYTTLDDGRVVRHVRLLTGGWRHETIYLGPQGPRGIAAGRFDADPNVETVAIFGYSKKVQLLTKRGATWKAETIFADDAKGHWLARAELDGRNATDELLATGYGGRIVLLARPPGYGREEAAADR